MEQSSRGVPGLSGMEHIGLDVPDLDEAIAFFCDVIGCDLMYRHGPYAYPDGTPDADNYFVNYLGQPADTETRIAMLRCGNGTNLELFETASASRNEHIPQFVDRGSSHFCFYVDDMEAAVGHLRGHDVNVFGGIATTFGVEAGEESTNTHFLSPWGQMLELISYPHGRLYEQDTSLRLWQPDRPETWRLSGRSNPSPAESAAQVSRSVATS
jgi:catechol 2,3-dioxygenase-like lactoylglutathione lyase family enzyme